MVDEGEAGVSLGGVLAGGLELDVPDLAQVAFGIDEWSKFFEGTGSPRIQSLNVAFPPFIRAFNAEIKLRPPPEQN